MARGASTLQAGKSTIVRHDDTASAVQAAVDAGRYMPVVPTFSSMLRQKAASGIKGLRPWRRRFYVLDDSGLAWFSNESHAEDRRRANGRVPLHLLTSAEALPAKGTTRFVLHVRVPRAGGTNTIHLEAESAGLMHRWLELISRHLTERTDGLCFVPKVRRPCGFVCVPSS